MKFNYCPYCGIKLNDSFIFCPQCGKSTRGGENAADSRAAKKPSAKKTHAEPSAEDGERKTPAELFSEIRKKNSEYYTDAGIERVTLAAESGDAAAQNELGYRYEFGEGVEEDYHTAAEWYEKSASQGYPRGQFNYGRMYYYGHNQCDAVEPDDFEQLYKRAVFWYEKAAAQGDMLAQCNLAYCLSRGRGIKKNDERACELYLAAAEQGSFTAINNLYNDYIEFYSGHDIIKLYKKHRTHFSGNDRADAKAGDVQAQFDLGNSYYNTSGKPNYKLAFKWYSLSAEGGCAQAQYALAEMYRKGQVFDSKGQPVERTDETEERQRSVARKLYYKSAMQGWLPAIDRCEDQAALQSIATHYFIDLCNEIAALPDEERKAFFGEDDEEDDE